MSPVQKLTWNQLLGKNCLSRSIPKRIGSKTKNTSCCHFHFFLCVRVLNFNQLWQSFWLANMSKKLGAQFLARMEAAREGKRTAVEDESPPKRKEMWPKLKHEKWKGRTSKIIKSALIVDKFLGKKSLLPLLPILPLLPTTKKGKTSLLPVLPVLPILRQLWAFFGGRNLIITYITYITIITKIKNLILCQFWILGIFGGKTHYYPYYLYYHYYQNFKNSQSCPISSLIWPGGHHLILTEVKSIWRVLSL